MRSNLKVKRAKLVAALKKPPTAMLRRLRELKKKAENLRARPDLLWFLIIQSAATQGNSRGWTSLSSDPATLKSIGFDVLARLNSKAREKRLLSALQKAKIRMPTIKAPRLAANFARITEMGGVKKATQEMLSLKSREEKLQFIRSFAGIGEKYGRNIWMDIYDPSFRDSIAVDARLTKVARELGFKGTNYRQAEAFFCAIAHDAGRQPWELDRLLYNFTDYFLGVVGHSDNSHAACRYDGSLSKAVCGQ